MGASIIDGMKLADETEALWRILRKQRGPLKPTRIEIRPTADSTGDPALEVWVLVSDATPESDLVFENTQPIRNRVKEVLREIGEERWPYVQFRTESEYNDMVRG